MLDTGDLYTPAKAGRLSEIQLEAFNWAREHGSCKPMTTDRALPSRFERLPRAVQFWTQAPTEKIDEFEREFRRAKEYHSTRWREINQAMVNHPPVPPTYPPKYSASFQPEWWVCASLQRAMHRYAERRCSHYLQALNRWKRSADAFNGPRYDQISPDDLSDGVRRVLDAVAEYDEKNGRLPHSPGGLFDSIQQDAVKAPLQACQNYFDNHDLPAPWRNASTDREKVEEWVRCARTIFK